MEKKLSYLTCQTSIAHTFGNLTAYIQNWLINQFPENTFKTKHVSSKIAHRQMRETPEEFFKKAKPMMIIRPRIEWGSDDVFLANTPITNKMGEMYSGYGGTNLQEFILDRKNRFSVKWQLNRHVINFDVILIFSTLIQQINFSNYIINRIRQNIPFTLDTCLESYIPKELMEVIAANANRELYNENNEVSDFLKYLNGISMYPITYKMDGGTGNDEFYRLYPVKIDTLCSGFSTDEGETTGKVKSGYQISFTLRCEFNSTGFYYLFSERRLPKEIITVLSNNTTLIPIYTDVFKIDDLELADGWSLYNSPSCKLDNSDYDEVDISPILNTSIKKAISYHIKNGIPIEPFFEIKVREQGKLLPKNVKFKFDPERLVVKFRKCSTYYTYKILILLNVEYINNLVADINKFK